VSLSTLRIAIVGPLPPPPGGMAAQTQQLAQLLSDAGSIVTVVQVNAPYRPAWVSRIKGIRAVARLVPYLARLFRITRELDVVHVMANSGWAWHLFAAPAIWIASLRGVPVVVNYRGGGAAAFLERSAASIRASLNRTSALVVPSGFLREIFARHGIEARIVPNIIDLNRFRPREHARREPAGPHLVVARNLEKIYDIPTAVRAFHRIRQTFADARLTVAGSGPEGPKLQELVRELDLASSVRFAGDLSRDEMGALYRDADVLLNPSTTDNMPNSILEALASGIPVVTTNVGGIPFIVEHRRTAMLVPPRDPVAMAEASLAVLRDPVLKADLVAEGLEAVRQYSWEAVRDRWIGVYASCVRNRSPYPLDRTTA
jgi:glycosyltransferase involved in cell wall biosynthesis